VLSRTNQLLTVTLTKLRQMFPGLCLGTVIKVAVMLGLFIVLVGFINQGANYVQTDKFCLTCHDREAYLETLENSGHSRFSCNSCHQQWQDTDAKSLRQVAREVYSQYSHQPLPAFLEGRNRVTDDVCLSCHSFARKVTPWGDLIIPHEDHQAKKVQCITCHRGLVHGDSNPRGIDATPSLMKEEYIREMPENTPPMGLCMSCHRRRQVTLECQACHLDLKLPEEHQQPEFKNNHGDLAREQVDTCNSCHRYTISTLELAQISDDVAEYARLNPFCGECHGNMPPSHTQPNFFYQHGQAGDYNQCLTCHNNNQGTGKAAAVTQCNDCHYQSHARGWQNRHPISINKGNDWSKQCYSCHRQDTCNSCHRR